MHSPSGSMMTLDSTSTQCMYPISCISLSSEFGSQPWCIWCVFFTHLGMTRFENSMKGMCVSASTHCSNTGFSCRLLPLLGFAWLQCLDATPFIVLSITWQTWRSLLPRTMRTHFRCIPHWPLIASYWLILHLFKCLMSIFDGLPDDLEDKIIILDMLFSHGCWHALAKLLLYTDDTLKLLDIVIVNLD